MLSPRLILGVPVCLLVLTMRSASASPEATERSRKFIEAHTVVVELLGGEVEDVAPHS